MSRIIFKFLMNDKNKVDVSTIFKATSFRLLKNGSDILIPHLKITEETQV